MTTFHGSALTNAIKNLYIFCMKIIHNLFLPDEKLKEKRDPIGFRDAILQGIGETEDLEQV